MDLFADESDHGAPLAWRMRPRTLADYVGQQALVGPGRPLARMVETGVVRSMILWGPPGSGKTTLAEILAAESGTLLVELLARRWWAAAPVAALWLIPLALPTRAR